MSTYHPSNIGNRQLLLSCQTLGWYHSIFDGEKNVDAALKFIRNCGFDGIDYHFEGVYTITQINNGSRSAIFDQTTTDLLAYYMPLKKARSRPQRSLLCTP